MGSSKRNFGWLLSLIKDKGSYRCSTLGSSFWSYFGCVSSLKSGCLSSCLRCVCRSLFCLFLCCVGCLEGLHCIHRISTGSLLVCKRSRSGRLCWCKSCIRSIYIGLDKRYCFLSYINSFLCLSDTCFSYLRSSFSRCLCSFGCFPSSLCIGRDLSLIFSISSSSGHGNSSCLGFCGKVGGLCCLSGSCVSLLCSLCIFLRLFCCCDSYDNVGSLSFVCGFGGLNGGCVYVSWSPFIKFDSFCPSPLGSSLSLLCGLYSSLGSFSSIYCFFSSLSCFLSIFSSFSSNLSILFSSLGIFFRFLASSIAFSIIGFGLLAIFWGVVLRMALHPWNRHTSTVNGVDTVNHCAH